MNPILDALTGNVLGTSFSELRASSFSSALNAYESWASELGVSSTASVSTLANVDDGSAVFMLGFNPFKDGTVLKGFHSSEGGIGLYYQQDPGSAADTSGAISATSPNVPLSRFYTGYARMPALLIATRLGTADNRSENSRWQQTSDTAIFYSTYRQYNGTNGTVHAAIKITKENKITVVCSNVNTANTYLQFMTFNESLTTRTATSVHGGTSFLLSLNTTQEVDLYLAAQQLSLNSELNLTPTLNSAFYLQATKDIQLTAGSSLSRFVFGWVGDTALFNEPLPIQQISLTFDQLGRPLVFYRVGEDTLKLYWYDPVAQQDVLTNFGVGKDPTACFDFPQDTGQPFTDVLLFYVRNDQIFMRIQRDRYAIEYPCPAANDKLKINDAGLRIDNRLQVTYEFKSVPEKNFKPFFIESSFNVVINTNLNFSSFGGTGMSISTTFNEDIRVNNQFFTSIHISTLNGVFSSFKEHVNFNSSISSIFNFELSSNFNVESSFLINVNLKTNFNSETNYIVSDDGYFFGVTNTGAFLSKFNTSNEQITQETTPNITSDLTNTIKSLPCTVSYDECWYAQVNPNNKNQVEVYLKSNTNFLLSTSVLINFLPENFEIRSVALSSNGNYLALGVVYRFLLIDTDNKSGLTYPTIILFKKVNNNFQRINLNGLPDIKGGFVTQSYIDNEIKKGNLTSEQIEELLTFTYVSGSLNLKFSPENNDLASIYTYALNQNQNNVFFQWFEKNQDLFELNQWPVGTIPATGTDLNWINENELVVTHAFTPFNTKFVRKNGSFRLSKTEPYPPARNVQGGNGEVIGWSTGAFSKNKGILLGGTLPKNTVLTRNPSETSESYAVTGAINSYTNFRKGLLSPTDNYLLINGSNYNQEKNITSNFSLFKLSNTGNYNKLYENLPFSLEESGFETTKGFGLFLHWFTKNLITSDKDLIGVEDPHYLKVFALVDLENRYTNNVLGVNRTFSRDERNYDWPWIDNTTVISPDREVVLNNTNSDLCVEFILKVKSSNSASYTLFDNVVAGYGFKVNVSNLGKISIVQYVNNQISTFWLSENTYTALNEIIHLALSSFGDKTTVYINGLNMGVLNSVLFMQDQSIRLKQNWLNLNQLRITKHHRYSGNFTSLREFPSKLKQN